MRHHGLRDSEPSSDRAHAPSGTPGKATLVERIYRQATATAATAADPTAAVARAADSTGAPLPDGPRARFEQSLGSDLSSVRVHTGAASAAAADDLGARAFATGQDIHFGAGQYRPDDPFGVHLLAHEVAHTVQQGGARGGAPQTKLEVSEPGDRLEVEADRAADAMVTGASAAVSGGAVARVARDPVDGADKKAAAAPGDDVVAAGEAALAAGMTHVSPVPADPQWTRSEIRFDDPAVERLLMHLITTWLRDPNPGPLTEIAADAQPAIPGWVPRFRTRALSSMKDDPPEAKRLSALATKLADAVAEKTAGEKFRETVIAKAQPGQAIMSQEAIDAQNDKTDKGKFTTCIAFAGQVINAAPRPAGAPKLPPFSGPNDYKEVNPAATKEANKVFPDGSFHKGTEGMSDRPKPGDLLVLGFAKATPFGEGDKRVVLARGAFAHIDILRAIQPSADGQSETWITVDGGGTASTQGTRAYDVSTNILTDKNGDRLLIGWFDVVRMAGL